VRARVAAIQQFEEKRQKRDGAEAHRVAKSVVAVLDGGKQLNSLPVVALADHMHLRECSRMNVRQPFHMSAHASAPPYGSAVQSFMCYNNTDVAVSARIIAGENTATRYMSTEDAVPSDKYLAVMAGLGDMRLRLWLHGQVLVVLKCATFRMRPRPRGGRKCLVNSLDSHSIRMQWWDDDVRIALGTRGPYDTSVHARHKDKYAANRARAAASAFTLDSEVLWDEANAFIRDVLELPHLLPNRCQCRLLCKQLQLSASEWSIVPTRLDRPHAMVSSVFASVTCK
jgi:hypothetical protein